jgi:AI-2 transport protein TqsA
MQDARTEQRIQTISLLVLAGFAAAFALYWMKPVLVPFVLALFISVGLRPVIDWQAERLRFPRNLAVATTLLLALLILFLTGLLVSTSVAQLAANRKKYEQNVADMLDLAASKLPLERLGLPGREQPGEPGEAEGAGEAVTAPDGAPGDTMPDAPAEGEADVPEQTSDEFTVEADTPVGEAILPGQTAEQDQADPLKSLLKLPVQAIGRMLVGTTGAVANIMSNGLLVVIFTCFLLFGGRARPEERTGWWAEIESGTRRYIVTKVVVSGVTGVLVGLILWLLKVELAMVFGLLAFMLNFIPNIGSAIATLLPLPVVLVTGRPALVCVLAIALPGAVQFTIGNVLEPRMMGKSMKMHPITILLALIFWGVLWGAVGMFLAVPMTSVIRIFLEKNEITEPVARLMAGDTGNGPAQ